MPSVQSLGEKMADAHGFLGVPTNTFDEGGRRQIIALLREGMSPESRVCEIGAGPLRVAYWLVRLLDPGCYAGIEPHEGRVKWGLETLFPDTLLTYKQPRFDFNDTYDVSVFNDTFDFFLAGSIWTHCGKVHIAKMLDEFLDNTVDDAVFLVSYLPAENDDDDYLGDEWVGTSHKSDVAGIVRHKLSWIEDQCAQRGLRVNEIPGPAFDSQTWLRIRRKGVPKRPTKL